MLVSDDISSVLLRHRLELLAYLTSLTGDLPAAQDIYAELCAQAHWREGGFKSASHLLECSRRAARQRVLERAGGRPRSGLLEATLDALDAEWARSQDEGTSAETLVALGQCLQTVALGSFKQLERRYREQPPTASTPPPFGPPESAQPPAPSNPPAPQNPQNPQSPPESLEPDYRLLARVHRFLAGCVKQKLSGVSA